MQPTRKTANTGDSEHSCSFTSVFQGQTCCCRSCPNNKLLSHCTLPLYTTPPYSSAVFYQSAHQIQHLIGYRLVISHVLAGTRRDRVPNPGWWTWNEDSFPSWLPLSNFSGQCWGSGNQNSAGVCMRVMGKHRSHSLQPAISPKHHLPFHRKEGQEFCSSWKAPLERSEHCTTITSTCQNTAPCSGLTESQGGNLSQPNSTSRPGLC